MGVYPPIAYHRLYSSISRSAQQWVYMPQYHHHHHHHQMLIYFTIKNCIHQIFLHKKDRMYFCYCNCFGPAWLPSHNILSRVLVPKRGFGLVIGFINHLQVATTIFITCTILHVTIYLWNIRCCLLYYVLGIPDIIYYSLILSLILWHVDLLLGSDHEISNYTTATAK
jgi:hypothetical protein